MTGPAVTALTRSWGAGMRGDDNAHQKFVRTDPARLNKGIDQRHEATGSPGKYTGRSVQETHDGMQARRGGKA
jgi:hypothetical protein